MECHRQYVCCLAVKPSFEKECCFVRVLLLTLCSYLIKMSGRGGHSSFVAKRPKLDHSVNNSQPSAEVSQEIADIACYLFSSVELRVTPESSYLSEDAKTKINKLASQNIVTNTWSIESYRKHMLEVLAADDPVKEFIGFCCTHCSPTAQTERTQQRELLWYLAYELVKFDAKSASNDLLDTFVLAIVLIKDSLAAKNFGALLEFRGLRDKFFGAGKRHFARQSVRDALYAYCTCKREDEINFDCSHIRDYSGRD